MEKKIITAASNSYSKQLLAFIGSANLNWPNHPPIEVYDLGLDNNTLKTLEMNSITVKAVPPFCPHWRKHFTWKIWCWKDTNADLFIYMDAGISILKPLDEIFEVIEKIGYVFFPNYRPLEEEASLDAIIGCGVLPEFTKGKSTLAGGFVGFNKRDPKILAFLNQLYELALDEKNLRATLPTHRHDQALMSILVYKTIPNPVILDGNIYLGGHSPIKVPGQKVWACRRSMETDDLEYFLVHSNNKNVSSSYLPKSPPGAIKNYINEFVYHFQRIYGRNKEEIVFLLLKPELGVTGLKFLKPFIKMLKWVVRIYRRVVWGAKIGKCDQPEIYEGVRE